MSLQLGLCGLVRLKVPLLTRSVLQVAPFLIRCGAWVECCSVQGCQTWSPKVRKARSTVADHHDCGDVFMYRDCSIAPLLDLRRSFKVVLDALDGMLRSGLSLSRSLELTAHCDSILRFGSLGTVTRADLQSVFEGGLGEFRGIVEGFHSRASEFAHRVVVHRRDVAVRSWRTRILEDPLVHPSKWLSPDMVPPVFSSSVSPILLKGFWGSS